MMFSSRLLLEKACRVGPLDVSGVVNKVVGLVVESSGPPAAVGDLCLIRGAHSNVMTEVVGLREEKVLSMALEDMHGIKTGAKIELLGERAGVPVGFGLLGRVLNGKCEPIDEKGPITGAEDTYPLRRQGLDPLKRGNITEPIATGVKSIDALVTVGKGQRMGIFSGSGVGKSILLGMIARNTAADVNVIALVGERGREVREFLERDLGEEGLKRTVAFVSTSDTPAPLKMRAAFAATSVAEFFRDLGLDVMLMMDSVTRLAMAQREIGLSAGEPPSTRGYPPSVFGMLPMVFERAGKREGKGSITGLYTVLVEGDDLDEPVSDHCRSILDGHVVLSRKLANRGHYPAVDILPSRSRVVGSVSSKDHISAASAFRRVVAMHRDNEDLINIGAYKKGSNALIDYAIDKTAKFNRFLCQEPDEKAEFSATVESLRLLVADAPDN
ncbi:MAG: FliI/YscN family ATPase [Candidatus Coatesbacteria bacterium]|nr:FliI/YscN family ATPase [Candidatus Coatesbacteria bacterium]